MTIPGELFQYRQWICWKHLPVNGRMTKVPISPRNGRKASSDDPATWSSYRHACVALGRYGCDGIGFVFTATDPFCGIDLDECCVDGEWKPEALAILRRLNSFSEMSPSGKGAHIVVKAKLPAGRHPKGIGLFDRFRYFTITGNHIAGTPDSIHDRQAEIDALYAELFPQIEAPATARKLALPLSDSQIIEKARHARNGEKFDRLWTGEITDFGGDWSAADLALCSLLAFWTGGDASRVDSLFRQSGLMRNKWDARRPGGTYGSNTIAKALARSVAA